MKAVVAAVALGAAMQTACGPGPARAPQAVDVRLDIVMRVLARASQAAPGDPVAKEAVDRAYVALYDAERAADAWRRGDPRPWMRARPCLAISLERVDVALRAQRLLPPPGLTGTFGHAPLEKCAHEEGIGAP